MDDIYDVTPEEEEDIKFLEKCEAQKLEALMKNGYCKDCKNRHQAKFSGLRC